MVNFVISDTIIDFLLTLHYRHQKIDYKDASFCMMQQYCFFRTAC